MHGAAKPGGGARVTMVIRAVVWALVYLGVVLAPLVFAVIGASRPDHDFWTDFARLACAAPGTASRPLP